MPAAEQRRIPMKTITRLTFRRLGAQIALLTRAKIDPMNEALLAFGVENVAISRIENDVEAVAAGKRDPIAITNSFFAWHLTWANEIFVVLQATGDAVERLRIVERDAIKFAGRNIK